MIISAAFAGKKYAVLGLARSGAAAAESLLASGAEVVAWDRQDVARKPFEDRCELADPLEIDLTGFAGVVVSPGVPLNTHPIAPYAEKYGVPVIGDIELFAQARGDLPPHKVVGVTGTNGKSTTVALIHHILQTTGIASRLGGNIGVPILGEEPLSEGGVYVLELSSYQIDLTQSLDCDVAVLLNITPDHLDRYDGSFEKYAASKARLFAMQSEAQICDGAKTFTGLPHRMERAAEHRGVIYINDSKATNQASTAPALGAYPPDPATNQGAPRIHWILGGLAKEDGLGECEDYLGNVACAYTIGEAGPRFAELLDGKVPVHRAELLCEAVRKAAQNARTGEVILFSPACASFDQFRDFEKRGEYFRQVVGALIEQSAGGTSA